MNLYIKEFLKNFIFGGSLIGLYSVIVKLISPAAAGQNPTKIIRAAEHTQHRPEGGQNNL